MTRGSILNLEIALSGVAAKVKPPTSFSAGPKCVEASDHVIKDTFNSAPASCLLAFSPTRLGARYAKFFSGSHHAVIRVYDHAGNVIETHEHSGDFKRVVTRVVFALALEFQAARLFCASEALLIVFGHLRCRSAHSEPRIHSLNLRRLLSDRCGESGDRAFQCRDLFVFFQKLV